MKNLFSIVTAKEKSSTKDLELYLVKNKESFYRFAYSHVRNEEDALDIVQDSIYKALKSSKQIKNTNNFNPWFYRILLNSSIDFLRKNKKYTYIDDELYLDSIASDDKYVDIDLENALDKLPEKYKTVVIFRYFEDMKLEEIAEILNENLSTVKTRLYTALKKLSVDIKF